MKHERTAALAIAIGCQLLLACNLFNRPCTVCPGVAGPAPRTLTTTDEPGTVLSPILPEEIPQMIQLVETDGGCPALPAVQGGAWLSRELFAARGRTECQYLWQTQEGTKPNLESFRNLRRFEDPPSLAMLSVEEGRFWFGPLHDLARARFDIPETPPAATIPTGRVQVAVIDSAAQTPAGKIIDPTEHGTMMAAVIREVACPDPANCSLDLRYYPALQFAFRGGSVILPDSMSGEAGSRTVLAQMIRRATDDWIAARGSGPQTPLIINLSLGWSGCYENPQREPPSRLVHEAIEYAACQGALVLAAGGNRDAISGCPNAPPPKGDPRHMFPGMWGVESVTPEQCTAAGIAAPAIHDAVPLLLGIGAVDYLDNQLSITDHEADLAAYGQAVSVPSTTDPSGWRKITGSSVAAAAASGMAALALRYKSTLDSRALVEHLYRSAIQLHPNTGTDFICNRAFAGGCKAEIVQRLSACAVLNNAIGFACTPLAALARTETPDIRHVAAGTAALPPPFPQPPACPGDPRCDWDASDENRDARDVPWVQGQGGSGKYNCTCEGPLGECPFPSLVAYTEPDTSNMTLQIMFDVPITEIKLNITIQGGATQRYSLGDAPLANEIRQWTFSVPGAQTAWIEYRLPDRSLEVSDVRLRSLPPDSDSDSAR